MTRASDEDDAPQSGDEQHGAARPIGLLGGRHTSAAVIGVLTLLLGFAIAVQVRANSSGDSLSALRDDDLIGILDNQDDRADRLRQQQAQLQDQLRQLQDSGDRSSAARKQALQQQQALGVLLGTLPATGPGVEIEVDDPLGKLAGEDLLDVVEELRGAGAEAMSVAGAPAGDAAVRIGTDTAFVGPAADVQVDGVAIEAPFRFVAIGDPTTLDTALNIPGGVASAIRADGGKLSVVERRTVVIRALRPLPKIRYARPGK